jgi:hypothetical protein
MKIEDFVNKHREEFDDKQPSEKLWSGVEASLPVHKNSSWWNSVVLWRAAAMVFMVVSAGLFFIPREKMAAPGKTDASLGDFQDVEAFYIQQISTKEQLIDEFKASEGLNGNTQSFQQLEAMYMVLKEEMRTRPSKKVKDALVLNLLVRIDLLNQQLYKLETESKDEGKEA